MKYTNDQNLPQPIVDAVIQARSAYSRGEADISATGLLRPPRIAVLEEAHAEELEVDVADCLYSLHGQGLHKLFEQANTVGVTERRFFIEVEGWTVSGQADFFLRGMIADYKDVTAWKFKGPGVPIEYEQQLNIYAELHRQNGHHIERLEIWAYLRDWSKLEARRDANYPQHQFLRRQVPLWPQAQARKFIRERVILHQQARLTFVLEDKDGKILKQYSSPQAARRDAARRLASGEIEDGSVIAQILPECTPEERWARPDVWAVMKRGRKSAVKLHTTKDAAELHVSTDPSTLSVAFRPGESVRCSAYCPVSKFCTQYAKLTECEPAAALATADEE